MSTIAAPVRSNLQRHQALEKANDVRVRRGRLKERIRTGDASIYDLLTTPPDYLLTAKVYDLLLAMPKYGRVKVNKTIACCRISPSKTLGGLTWRQREELAEHLRRRNAR